MDLSSNQNKQDWCAYGSVMEHVFIGLYGQQLDLMINPSKTMCKDGKYKPDLYNYSRCLVSDLKTCQTPFYLAKKLYGMDPQTTVTFDRKDAERYYRNYPNIIIYFWVMYPSGENYGVTLDEVNGVWKIDFDKLMSLLKTAKEHTHKDRVNDTAGNGKSDFLLSLDEMERVI